MTGEKRSRRSKIEGHGIADEDFFDDANDLLTTLGIPNSDDHKEEDRVLIVALALHRAYTKGLDAGLKRDGL